MDSLCFGTVFLLVQNDFTTLKVRWGHAPLKLWSRNSSHSEDGSDGMTVIQNTAKVTTEWLKKHMEVVEWPPQSTDGNPAENV